MNTINNLERQYDISQPLFFLFSGLGMLFGFFYAFMDYPFWPFITFLTIGIVSLGVMIRSGYLLDKREGKHHD